MASSSMRSFEDYRAIWRFWRLSQQEIFTISDEELDRQAAAFRADGFTHLMTFMVHFRLSFRREFPRLTELLARMVVAAHRHGLKLVEHHSANLLYTFDTPTAAADARRQNDPALFPHLEEDCSLESLWDGMKLKEMCQISGDTGEPVLSFMNSRILCHNNPDYRKRYLDYLSSLYATGIDGIMTDDIQFVSAAQQPGKDFDMDSCNCPHCRRLFQQQTGYVLPESGEAWREFQRHRDSPRFLAWKRFRVESILQFHREVAQQYESRGLRMLRPSYTATSVSWVSPWAFSLDNLPQLDWVFVEHCCGALRYSWPEYLVESTYVEMVARQRALPSMALYYPVTPGQQRLGWGLSLYSGLRYFGDPGSKEMFPEQKRFHEFEARHEKELFCCRQCARVAMWDSQMARELQPDYNTTTRFRFNSIAQSLLMNNVGWTMVNPEHPGEYDDFDLIILAGAKYVSDEQLQSLGASSARLAVFDASGRSHLDGTPRTEEALLALLNPRKEPGKLIFVYPGERTAPFYRRCRADGEGNRDAFNCSEPDRWRLWNTEEEAASCALARFIRGCVPRLPVEVEDAPRHLLVSAFTTMDGRLSIRLVNAASTLIPPGQPGYGHGDEVVFEPPASPVRLSLRRTGLHDVRIYTLENGQGELPFTETEQQTQLSVPPEFLRDFALVVAS